MWLMPYSPDGCGSLHNLPRGQRRERTVMEVRGRQLENHDHMSNFQLVSIIATSVTDGEVRFSCLVINETHKELIGTHPRAPTSVLLITQASDVIEFK